jgi:hypothetical protein
VRIIAFRIRVKEFVIMELVFVIDGALDQIVQFEYALGTAIPVECAQALQVPTFVPSSTENFQLITACVILDGLVMIVPPTNLSLVIYILMHSIAPKISPVVGVPPQISVKLET